MVKILLPLVVAGLLLDSHAIAAQARKGGTSNAKKTAAVKKSAAVKKPAASAKAPAKSATAKAAKKPGASRPSSRKGVVRSAVVRRPLTAPPVDPTEGDNVEGEDLVVRRAAVAALGTTRGSVVVADPNTGRILTIVNQKLGLQSGFTPCSTIKLVTSLAALNEHVVERETPVKLGRYSSLTMTTAIAHSNNPYFATLGTRLGFERVTKYAQTLGLGEKAGFDIQGEKPGTVPASESKSGGVGMMTSFGEGFLMTPLELTALIASIANGGTLYYLQYPRTETEVENFTPRVKRTLDLAPESFADVKIGMRGAVEMGTARRAGYATSEPVLGKTGTCTDFSSSSHMGWFGSYNDVGNHPLVVVVMLAAVNKSVSGPVASGVAGAIYKTLAEQRYFTADADQPKTKSPEILATMPANAGR